MPFVNEGEKGVQAANNQSADESRYGYIRYLSSQRMPTPVSYTHLDVYKRQSSPRARWSR